MKFFVALLACSFLMLFSMVGVNAVENNTTDGTVINDINVLEEENNPLQSSDTDSTSSDTEDQTDTATYQASAEDPPINSVSIEEVEAASVFLSGYVASHNTLPETIQVGSYTLTMAQFLKVLLTTTIHLDQGITDSINIDAVDDAPNPAGNVNYGNILKSEYLRNAINILYFMDSYGRAPNYWGTSLGNLRFEGLVFSYSNIMDFYEGNDRLPNYTKISPSDYMGLVTVEEVEMASAYLKDYVEANKALPATIRVGSYTLTMAQFLKVLLYTTLQLDQGNHNPIKISAVNNASNPSDINVSGNILKSEYLRNAINILYFMKDYGRAPNYWLTSLGNLRYEAIVLSYAKIIDFHEYYNRLPNYIKISRYDFNNYNNVHGIWIQSASVYTLEVSELIKMDITDVFVICKRTGSNIYSTILPILLNKLQGTSIRVHAWIICFHDDSGFIDPSNETYQQDLINYISLLMNNYNIDGVHLDYVRYPGDAYNHNGTEVITNFVEDVYNRVKSINNGLAVSATLMPEKESNAYYYGQDYGLLAPYLDFMVPMIYKYEYTQTTAWIASTTQYIVGQAGDTPVIAGLQTYNDDYEPILPAELRNDINVAVANGSCGFALFRYGLIHEDFTY